MRVQEWPVDKVLPYAGNPRRNDEAVGKVAASIREFGFRQPIVVDADGTVVVGHTRLRAAKELGLETVPVVVASDLTPAQAAAYRLADNKTAEFAEWDLDLLAEELDGLAADFDMGDFGFGDWDLGADDVNTNTRPTPSEFKEFGENIETKNTCPMCGYEW